VAWQAAAVPTSIIIRAKAKDAKFIGSSMGGARVVVRSKHTGTILAQGKTTGGTGDTKLIMKTPHDRYMQLAKEGTAQFVANLDIDQPTLLHIEVFASMGQTEIEGTTEVWAIPGKDILGDGIVVEIPGFVVEVLQPRTHQFIALKSLEGKKINIQANIVMMCGCTISKGGLWDADKMEVRGLVTYNGKPAGEVDLACTAPNMFEGTLAPKGTGTYEVAVYAYMPNTGNTGLDKVNFIISD